MGVIEIGSYSGRSGTSRRHRMSKAQKAALRANIERMNAVRDAIAAEKAALKESE